ncbi:glycosyltransferase family 4 protein [Patescibacteria group bacterium]|nr:glycosyltransferase family 4 protein [Patescibacteria group bacterium]
MKTIGLEATRADKKYKTGTEWYAWHLLNQFKKLDKENKFFVYYNQNLAGDLMDAPENFYFKQLKWPFSKFWTHLRLGFELIIHPVEKFFASNAVPIMGRGEIIVTIHDLGFLKNPDLYHPLERWYQKWSHNIAVKRSKKIITISNATKQDIIKYYPQAKDKIKVIYLGWDSSEFGPISREDKLGYVDEHDHPEKYILYTGRIETKKNVQNLIRAYRMGNFKWPLMLAGRPGNFGYQEIQNMIKDTKIKNDVIILGYVSQKNYTKLIASASMFVFPSKFEGFGLPILEAMASGVPVVCSDMPVLHEVAGEAAVYFDPDNPQDIKDKMTQVYQEERLREILIAKGLKRAGNFSWQKCAQETLDYILDKS